MRTRLFLFCLLGPILAAMPALADETARVIPPPALDNPHAPGDSQVVVLAGGCYWGMQAVFEHLKGIQKVVAGFTGPPRNDPNAGTFARKDVPAESVEITFDPNRISYGQILQVYFSVAHDPTEINMQGPDKGPQYRSNIFFSDNTQEKISNAYIAQLQSSGVFGAPIATGVNRLIDFHRVDGSQQDFVLKNPTLPYVAIIDMPKLAALKTLFPDLYLDPPLTYSSR